MLDYGNAKFDGKRVSSDRTRLDRKRFFGKTRQARLCLYSRCLSEGARRARQWRALLCRGAVLDGRAGDLRAEPDKIFLFGDNLKQAGYGGQAKEMRGEENAVGIPSKKAPSNSPTSFFTDKEFDANKKAIDEADQKLSENDWVMGEEGKKEEGRS